MSLPVINKPLHTEHSMAPQNIQKKQLFASALSKATHPY